MANQPVNRARYYDAAIGAWISQDPIGFGGGNENLYGYVDNDPILRADSSGLTYSEIQAKLAAFTVAKDFEFGIAGSPSLGNIIDAGINQVDAFAAGMCEALLAGYCTNARSGLYGEYATQNHHGGAFVAGEFAGGVVAFGIGFYSHTAVGLLKGLFSAYQIADAAVAFGTSTYHAATGQFTWSDTFGFIPAMGWLSRKAYNIAKTGKRLREPPIKPGSAHGPTAGQPFPKSIKDAAKAENPTATCVFCRRKGTGTQVDHSIPKARGGNATLDNAQLACPHCNASKGARDFPVTPPPGYRGPWPP